MPTERIGCLENLFRLFGLGNDRPFRRPLQGLPPLPNLPPAPVILPTPKAMVNKFFFSAAEVNFFRVLQGVVGERGVVLVQVSLKQLIYLPKNQSNAARSVWQNKIDKRSIDFVICDVQTLRPRVVIELDDSTHGRPDRQTRDDEVQKIFAAAGLPLVRCACERAYSTRDLAAKILPHL